MTQIMVYSLGMVLMVIMSLVQLIIIEKGLCMTNPYLVSLYNDVQVKSLDNMCRICSMLGMEFSHSSSCLSRWTKSILRPVKESSMTSICDSCLTGLRGLAHLIMFWREYNHMQIHKVCKQGYTSDLPILVPISTLRPCPDSL